MKRRPFQRDGWCALLALAAMTLASCESRRDAKGDALAEVKKDPRVLALFAAWPDAAIATAERELETETRCLLADVSVPDDAGDKDSDELIARMFEEERRMCDVLRLAANESTALLDQVAAGGARPAVTHWFDIFVSGAEQRDGAAEQYEALQLGPFATDEQCAAVERSARLADIGTTRCRLVRP